MYFQYSHRLTNEMVRVYRTEKKAKMGCNEDEDEEETSDEEDEEKKLKQSLSATVRCPICLDPIAVTKGPNVLTNGVFVSYFLLSNFFKHLRIHLKENKPNSKRKLRDRNPATDQKTDVKRVKRGSVQPNVKQAKPSRGRPHQKQKNKTEDSSTESDEYVELENRQFDKSEDSDDYIEEYTNNGNN